MELGGIHMKNTNYKEVKQAFGKIVYTNRKKKNISQTKLANKIHLEPSNIGRIERGESAPTFYTLIKLSQALEIDLTTHIQSLSELIYAAELADDHD